MVHASQKAPSRFDCLSVLRYEVWSILTLIIQDEGYRCHCRLCLSWMTQDKDCCCCCQNVYGVWYVLLRDLWKLFGLLRNVRYAGGSSGDMVRDSGCEGLIGKVLEAKNIISCFHFHAMAGMEAIKAVHNTQNVWNVEGRPKMLKVFKESKASEVSEPLETFNFWYSSCCWNGGLPPSETHVEPPCHRSCRCEFVLAAASTYFSFEF